MDSDETLRHRIYIWRIAYAKLKAKNYVYLVINAILVYHLSLLFLVLTFITFECVR